MKNMEPIESSFPDGIKFTRISEEEKYDPKYEEYSGGFYMEVRYEVEGLNWEIFEDTVLESMLEDSISREDYEYAANIRDEIRLRKIAKVSRQWKAWNKYRIFSYHSVSQ